MHFTKYSIPLAETEQFSSLFIDFINKNEKLSEWDDIYPDWNKLKDFSDIKCDRKLLYERISNQYKGYQLSAELIKNKESLLDDHTYTITTGHQLNVFTGPLYCIYKIITTIQLARKLSEQYPERKFVPLFWMASEDHDFAEINHFNLFGKKYTWKSDYAGAVGRMSLEGINEIIAELPEQFPVFEKAYTEFNTLSEASRYLLNELFGSYGLLILDPDDKALKRSFQPFIEEDLFSSVAYEKVNKTNKELENKGYALQAQPREINWFYLKEGLRERIIKTDKGFEINHTDLHFSGSAMRKEIEDYPENFSPNVIMRPLYQQYILPNMVYIGGPAELAYWLQLKELFRYYSKYESINYPILLPRNFVTVIPPHLNSKMKKLGISCTDLFMEEHELKQFWMRKNAGESFEIDQERNEIKKLFNTLKHKGKTIDPGLEAYVAAQESKLIKGIDQIEGKLRKAEEQKHQQAIHQLLRLKNQLFPDQGLQERSLNLLNFLANDALFIEGLMACLEPFDFQMNILMYAEV